jgi:hypothetical protein
VASITLPPGVFDIAPQTLDSVGFGVTQLWSMTYIPMLAVHYSVPQKRRIGLL